jgi:hypothetical protein
MLSIDCSTGVGLVFSQSLMSKIFHCQVDRRPPPSERQGALLTNQV